MKNEIYNFRKYKRKEGKNQKFHPKLIVDIKKENFGYLGLIHNKSKGKKHRNIKLIVNPQIDKKTKKHKVEQSYLRKKIEYDNKNYFSNILKDYALSDFDKQNVISYINKHKKR